MSGSMEESILYDPYEIGRPKTTAKLCFPHYSTLRKESTYKHLSGCYLPDGKSVSTLL